MFCDFKFNEKTNIKIKSKVLISFLYLKYIQNQQLKLYLRKTQLNDIEFNIILKIGKVFGYALIMKKIYIIITILAISCTPVRKSFYEDDGNETSYNKQIKNKKGITEREKRQDINDDSNAEYKPDSDVKDETYSAKPEIYYQDETSDTISLNENSNLNK